MTFMTDAAELSRVRMRRTNRTLWLEVVVPSDGVSHFHSFSTSSTSAAVLKTSADGPRWSWTVGWSSSGVTSESR